MRYCIASILALLVLVVKAQLPTHISCEADKIKILTKDTGDMLMVFRGHLTPFEIKNAQPVGGNISRTANSVKFTPILPFLTGNRYSLQWQDKYYYFKIGAPNDYIFLKVNNVYPSSPDLPANIKRWYVKFNKNLDPESINNNIVITTSSGDTLDYAFNSFDMGSKENQLLKLTAGNERLFKPGHSYHLTISGRIRDENGWSMRQDWKHTIHIKSEDITPSDPADWSIEQAKIASRMPIKIQCDKSMDYISFIAGIEILSPSGEVLKGRWTSSSNEKNFQFAPNLPWQEGKYAVRIKDTVEDISGNYLSPFVDVEKKTGDEQHAFIELPFEMKK